MLFSFYKWTSYVKSYMNNLPKNSAYLLHLRRVQNYKRNHLVYTVQAKFSFFKKVFVFIIYKNWSIKTVKRESKLIIWNITASGTK